MIRFATVGTGWITEALVKGALLLPESAKLVAVYSRSYEKGKQFADLYGCDKVYTDLKLLCENKEIDAVYVASPNACHYAQSKMFLSAGKHVLCEKPATVTSAEMRELLYLAKKNGLIYMEALMARHLPQRTAVLKSIKKLGKISQVRFDFSQRSSKYDLFLKGEHQNIFDPEMAAGTLMDLGIYCVYPCLDWFGEPENITAICKKAGNGIDIMGGAVFDYKDFVATLTYSKIGQSAIGSEIIGDEGTLIIPSISKLTEITLKHKDGSTETVTENLEKPELMSFELKDFCRYIEDKTAEKEYQNVSNLALSVAVKMEQMRNDLGLDFKSKEV